MPMEFASNEMNNLSVNIMSVCTNIKPNHKDVCRSFNFVFVRLIVGSFVVHYRFARTPTNAIVPV